ncbi:MAG: DUF2069 domain-containing protein [Betaproteobacteria bacterium]
MTIGPLPGTTARQASAWRWSMAAWIALIALGLSWELTLAPLRPGGSWLALKVVPLLLPLPAMLRGSAYAMQVGLFIVLLSILEGSVRLFEPVPVAWLAAMQCTLAVIFFIAAIIYLRPMKIAAKRRAQSS